MHPILLIGMISSSALLFPLVLGISRFEALDKPLKALVVLCGLALLIEIANYTQSFRGASNAESMNVYIVLEFLCLATLYGWSLNRIFPFVVFGLLMAAFVGLFLVETLYLNPWPGLLETSQSASNILIITFPILHFIQMIRTAETGRLSEIPMFYINLAVLMYFAGRLLLWAFMSQLSQAAMLDALLALTIAHAVLNFLHYILFGIALWKSQPQN